LWRVGVLAAMFAVTSLPATNQGAGPRAEVPENVGVYYYRTKVRWADERHEPLILTRRSSVVDNARRSSLVGNARRSSVALVTRRS
jgi:hypothetical protein